MAVQAPTVISSSVIEEVSPWQNLGPAQPARKVAQPQHLVPDGHLEKAPEGSDFLQKLAVSREVTPREEVKGRAPAPSYTHPKTETYATWRMVLCGVRTGPKMPARQRQSRMHPPRVGVDIFACPSSGPREGGSSLTTKPPEK